MNIHKLEFPEIIETSRLLLKPIVNNHKNEVLSILSNKELRESIKSSTVERGTEFDEWWESRNQIASKLGLLQWCAFLKDTSEFCALLTLKEISARNNRAEVGYSLLPKFWRKGLGFEAVEGTVEYGFKQMDLHSIFAQILTTNTASIRIVEKLKFEKEGHFKDYHLFNGSYNDLVQFFRTNPDH